MNESFPCKDCSPTPLLSCRNRKRIPTVSRRGFSRRNVVHSIGPVSAPPDRALDTAYYARSIHSFRCVRFANIQGLSLFRCRNRTYKANAFAGLLGGNALVP